MNRFSARIASFLLFLILVEKASARQLGWKPSWDDDWGSSSSSSSSKSSKSSGKSSKSSWGGWDDDDDDDWKSWKGWRGGGHHKKKNRGWRTGEYIRGKCIVLSVDKCTYVSLPKIVGYHRWGGRDLNVEMGDSFDKVIDIEEKSANEALGN